MSELLALVRDTVGWPWQVAFLGLFVASVFEAARPKPHEAETGWIAALRALAAIAGIVTPVLLFFHAFWLIGGYENGGLAAANVLDVILTRRVLIVALLILLGGAIVVAWLLGLLLRMQAGLARVLYRLSLPLSLIVCAFTIYVTWDNARGVVTLFMQTLG